MLPIDAHLPAILAALRMSPTLLLRAETGAGKTTRVPAALTDHFDGRTIVLEPRRIAARAAAHRVAHERGWQLGREVGWHVRFERHFDEHTRLLFSTEGMLVRHMQRDPFLEGVSCIVFDEFHERSVHADLALALARRIQHEVREDLRLVVMSATLDLLDLAHFLPDARRIDVPGRTFPIDVRWGPPAAVDALPAACLRALDEALVEDAGDVLVFLPGRAEIHAFVDAARRAHPALEVLPLYGELSSDAQDRVFAPGPQRRVIAATNVAEASLTVPRVRSVIDTGWARQSTFHAGRGLDGVRLVRISAASAAQRAGRAGREAPGVCRRLWSPTERLAAHDPPEILRVDPAPTVLQLLDFGEQQPQTFPLLTAPSTAAFEGAMLQLTRLGACAGAGITAGGRILAALPLPPRLARLLTILHARGVGRAGALACAILSERDIVRRDPGAPAPPPSLDLEQRIDVLDRGPSAWPTWVDAARGAHVRRVADQLERALRSLAPPVLPGAGVPLARCLGEALAGAFPDRIAQRRGPHADDGVLVGGRGVRFDRPGRYGDALLIVCLDIDDAGTRDGVHARVREGWPVTEAMLPAHLLTEEEEIRFDPETGRVIARRTRRFIDRVLSEQPTQIADRARARALLEQAVADDPARWLRLDEEPQRTMCARVATVARAMPELGLPSLDATFWREVAAQIVDASARLDALPGARIVEAIRHVLGWEAARRLDTLAPLRIEVPSGSSLPIVWDRTEPPVLAVRIQEVFGWTETPSVCDRRVALTLHLLAPNYRPQQVTTDLRSFWSGTYHEVRRELRRRYPKHAWPEDPWTARAERRGPSQRR